MQLTACGIDAFADATRHTGFACFGASQNIRTMMDAYPSFHFATRIRFVADNDPELQGKCFRTMRGAFPIVSVAELVRAYQEDPALCLLICNQDCREVYVRLNGIPELDGMRCYVYSLFAFCDYHRSLPPELSALRDGAPCIPKKIHHCWFGGEEIPRQDQAYIDGWRKLCPDYEIIRWNEANYNVFSHPFMAQAYRQNKFSFVSDYARLDIVYRYGGIYLDTDVEMLRPYDDLLYSSAFFGLVSHTFVNSGHGFGARPGNPVVGEMRDMYDGVVFANNGEQCSSSAEIETMPLRRRGFIGGNRFFIHPEVVVYPVEFFSPYSLFFGIPNLTANCHSIHRFHLSWANTGWAKERKLAAEQFSGILADARKEAHI